MSKAEAQLAAASKRSHTRKLMRDNRILYLFLAPALIYLIIFNYAPLYGIQVAFRQYVPSKGIWGSTWVGLKYFERFFSSPRVGTIIWNTLALNLYGLIASFPMPIILALIFNYIDNRAFKRFAQTVTYLPHFISVVVLVGMMSAFMSPYSGFINTIIEAFGGTSVYFFGSEKYFRHLFVWSGVWQNVGWGSIIYLAALTGVSPELHEAAVVDGATRIKRIWHIDLPSIMPTMAILLILNCGSMLSVGFDKAYLLQNNLNLQTSEVISTYVYKEGLINRDFGYSTAIGLFNNVVNFSLLLLVNKITGKLSGSSLW